MGLFREHFHWKSLASWQLGAIGVTLAVAAALRVSDQHSLALIALSFGTLLALLKCIQAAYSSASYSRANRFVFVSVCSTVIVTVAGAIAWGIGAPPEKNGLAEFAEQLPTGQGLFSIRGKLLDSAMPIANAVVTVEGHDFFARSVHSGEFVGTIRHPGKGESLRVRITHADYRTSTLLVPVVGVSADVGVVRLDRSVR